MTEPQEYRGWYIYGPDRWGLYSANRDRSSYYCFVSAYSREEMEMKIDRHIEMQEEN